MKEGRSNKFVLIMYIRYFKQFH